MMILNGVSRDSRYGPARDLHRLGSLHYGVRCISHSDVVHVDGPRSVEGAFTPEEVQALAEAAGLHGCRVTPKWPFRFLLEWSRS